MVNRVVDDGFCLVSKKPLGKVKKTTTWPATQPHPRPVEAGLRSDDDMTSRVQKHIDPVTEMEANGTVETARLQRIL